MQMHCRLILLNVNLKIIQLTIYLKSMNNGLQLCIRRNYDPTEEQLHPSEEEITFTCPGRLLAFLYSIFASLNTI